MYTDRNHVREIVNKVRTNAITHEKALIVSNRNKKQLATYYHDVLVQVIDEEYNRIMTEKS